MTLSQRDNFIPENQQQSLANELAQGWRSASEFVWANQQRRADALLNMGDFILEEAQQQWDGLRDDIGDGLTAYNEILSLVSTPCEDKWTVLLETALPAAGDALYLLLVPSPNEILENYLNPGRSGSGGKGGRGTRGTERRRGRNQLTRRRWPGVPDVDQLIADNIPGRDAMRGRPAGAPTRWLFTGIDLTDRVLWYFLLVDVWSTFGVAWSSGLREARFCSQPAKVAITASAIPQPSSTFFYALQAGDWLIETETPDDAIDEFGRVLVDADGTLIVSQTVEIRRPGGFTPLEQRLQHVIEFEDGGQEILEDVRTWEPGATKSFELNWERAGVRRVRMAGQVPPASEILSGQFSALMF